MNPVRAPQTALKMGFSDFKPVHGSGSGASDNELDEQFRLQQEMLKARRDHINHEVLAKKYAKDKQDLDVFALGKNYESDKYQDTYIDEKDIQTQAKKKKFPWQNMKP
eukprot:859019_1